MSILFVFIKTLFENNLMLNKIYKDNNAKLFK